MACFLEEVKSEKESSKSKPMTREEAEQIKKEIVEKGKLLNDSHEDS